MKKILLIAALSILPSCNAWADWDAALEAREAAQKKAAAEKEAREKAKTDKLIYDANMQGMRQQLGKDAAGKSDAEVQKLYKARVDAYQKQAPVAAANAAKMERDVKKLDADTRPERDKQMKAMTGKSVTELQNMSDKELEAYAKEMEKKFGVK
jgi:hypothetical protein